MAKTKSKCSATFAELGILAAHRFDVRHFIHATRVKRLAFDQAQSR